MAHDYTSGFDGLPSLPIAMALSPSTWATV
jgi:hypothetical protein